MVTLEEIVVVQAPVTRCFDLARSVDVHVLDNVHWGESAKAIGGVATGLSGLGERTVFQARHFGFRQRLTSEITAMIAPFYFRDTMIQGIFKSMQHDHYFRVMDDGNTEMRDVFRFAAPIPLFGRVSEILVLRHYMRALLGERMSVVKTVAESADWQKYLG